MNKLKKPRWLSQKARLVSLVVLATVLVGVFTFVGAVRHHQEVVRHETELRLQKEVQQKSEKFAKLEEQKKITAVATPKEEVSTGAPTDSTNRAARPSAASKPGDLIGNNVVKSAKTYYGGPLIFTPSTVTVSSSNRRPNVTIASYDGTAVSMPSSYWDSKDQVFVGIDSNLPIDIYTERSSWPMLVDKMYNLAPGTYTAEVVARTHKDNDTIEYSGHLTVIVMP